MIKRILKANKKFFVISIVTSLLASAATLAIPFFSNQIFSDLKHLNLTSILIVIAIMFFNYLLQLGLILFRENVAVGVNSSNLNQFLEKLFHVRYDTLTKNGAQSLVDKTFLLVNGIYRFLMNDLITAISSALILMGSLLFIFTENIWYGLVLVATIPITSYGFKAINKELSKRSKKLNDVSSKNFQDIVAIYENPDFLKQFSSYEGIEHLIARRIKSSYLAHAEINRFAGSSSKVIFFINEFAQNALLLLISYQVTLGQVKLGSLVVFNLVINIFFDALYSLPGINLSLANLKASTEFYKEEILDQQEPQLLQKLPQINTIRFENPTITLGEETFPYTLQRSFKTGDIIYMDAKSGAGKSTLVRALLNIRPATGIFLNDTLVNQLDPAALREKIAYVPQQSVIIPGSLRENILVDTTHDLQLDEKMKALKILQPILKNKTLDTELLKNGENLSGGEKQRVAIARSLMKEADIYIFDEITSNLDDISQAEFFSDFLADFTGKIVFLISHDKSVITYTNQQLKL